MKQLLFCLSCVFSFSGMVHAQNLLTPAQDQGLPYTRSAKPRAIAKIKNQIAVYAGSRYAWVNGYKMRLDELNWHDEAIAKDHDLYIPLAFASILSLKTIQPDPAPVYLKDKWIYTIHRPAIGLNQLKTISINKRAYVSFSAVAKMFGFQIYQYQEKLWMAGKEAMQFSAKESDLIESIIVQFDSPEKFADPDLATKYIPSLARQGKWTDHVKVSDAQKAILEGPETKWKYTPKEKYNYTGFNAKLLGSKPPAPGVYPRILFNEEDLPMLAQRIKQTKIGQMSLIEIEYLLQHSWWDENTSDGKVFKQLYTGNLEGLEWPKDGPIPNAPPSSVPHQFKNQKPGIYNSHISYVPECLSNMALYCLLTNDNVHGKQAATAIANYFKLREPLIDEWNAASDSEMSTSYTKEDGTKVLIAGNGSETSWRNIHGVVAHMNLGFCLDFAGKWMTQEEKKIMYRVIAKATYGRRAYGQDGPARFRDINWVTWDLPNFLAVTAIEGQEGFDKESYETNCETVKAFCEWGIDSAGVIYESNGKTPGGMQFHTLSMIALARRGENLWGHPHIRKLLEGQIQMTSPSGTVIVNSGTQYTPFSQQQFSLQTVNEYKSFYPNNKAADYLLAQSKTFYDKDPSFREAMREWVLEGFDPEKYRLTVSKVPKLRMPSPMYPGFVHGLLYDCDYDYTVTRKDLNLPLDFNAPVHGVFSGYSDAGKDAVWINMMVRPNHYLGGGHHHADAGMFHFSALGVDWITESPFTQVYDGKYHNQVLVDGISEPEGSSGLGTGYQAAAKYLGATTTSSGSFAVADLTNSYSYRWQTQPANIWEPKMAALSWELDPSPQNLKIFAGTARYKMRPWWATYNYSNYIATSRALYNPMKYVYRSVGLVRGKHPYGIVMDNLQKDSLEHLYEWTAMLNGGVWKAAYEHLAKGQMVLAKNNLYKTDSLAPQTINPINGDPLLLIVSLEENNKDHLSKETITVDREKGPVNSHGANTNWYDRIKIAYQGNMANFKVLLIPFKYGEVLPKVSYKNGKANIQWEDGTMDELLFTKTNNNRNLVRVNRNGKFLLKSN